MPLPARGTAWLVLAVILSFGHIVMAETDAAKYPSIVARLGMGLDELKAGSSYDLPLSRVTDADLTAATQPSILTYTGPNGFTLPPAHLVTLDSTAAVISAIEVSPHLDPLGLNAAIDLVEAVQRILGAAGWRREDQNMVAIEELRVRVRDPGAPDQARWPVARFVLGPVEAVLAIKRVERASRLGGLLGGSDAFIVKVEISDEALGQRLDRVAAALNRQDGTTLPRVVELAPYLARVRAILDGTN